MKMCVCVKAQNTFRSFFTVVNRHMYQWYLWHTKKAFFVVVGGTLGRSGKDGQMTGIYIWRLHCSAILPIIAALRDVTPRTWCANQRHTHIRNSWNSELKSKSAAALASPFVALSAFWASPSFPELFPVAHRVTPSSPIFAPTFSRHRLLLLWNYPSLRRSS